VNKKKGIAGKEKTNNAQPCIGAKVKNSTQFSTFCRKAANSPLFTKRRKQQKKVQKRQKKYPSS